MVLIIDIFFRKINKKSNISVKLILIKDKKYKSNFIKIIYKLIRFLKVEFIILFYSIFKNYYCITDFNPSILALFSKNVFIQIHDVSWKNDKFARHNLIFYEILKFF